MKLFNKGDKVIVINEDATYTTYSQIIKQNIKDYYDGWNKQETKKPEYGDIVTILDSCFHEDSNDLIYFIIGDDGKVFAIGYHGVEEIKQ